MDDFKDWLENNISRVPKISLTYKAIYYSLNQWGLLVGYCDDGQLNISNALAENAIRPFAIGRKNWLFSDTSRGVKANGLEPYKYLHYVLQHIAEAKIVDDIEALLPWNMK